MTKKAEETTPNALEKQLESLKEDVETLQRTVKKQIETETTKQIEELLRGWKIQKDSLFDTIEQIKSTQNLFIKETNMKIGAMRGLETKRSKPEIVATTDSIEEAIEFANIERRKQGLPPINIPSIDHLSKKIDEEPHPLTEK